MDAVTLDRTLEELRPLLVGRHLSRPRLGRVHAVAFEVSGFRDRRLWIDAARATAGIYWLARDSGLARAEAAASPPAFRAGQALLHLRKHLDGARVDSIGRVPGERTVVLRSGGATLVLRLAGVAPALSLALDEALLGSLGEGPVAWPLPPQTPEREWDRVEPAAFEAAVAAGREHGRSLVRAVLAACPGLGPLLARETDGSAASFAALRERLRGARPHLLLALDAGTAGPPLSWPDSALADPMAVTLAPLAAAGERSTPLVCASWLEAGALFLEARRRGLEFDSCRRAALVDARRQIRHLERLEANLAQDLAGLADEADLRRRAEALLAFARGLEAGHERVDVQDPYDADRRLVVPLDPRLGGLANAERLFARARRVGRARHEVELRLRETRSALAVAREREAGVLDARDRGELPGPKDAGKVGPSGSARSGPRHYLTSRGLSVLVGRNARENHHLTFRVARAEDLWLHARDAPGAHVVLRDNEGRAGADDLREAAEVAAFFSEASAESLVDVHVTRRKHLKPAKGGPGRVFVSHSETLRVAPRDPEGRLRKR